MQPVKMFTLQIKKKKKRADSKLCILLLEADLLFLGLYVGNQKITTR